MALAINKRPRSLSELHGNSGLKKSLGSILNRKLHDIPHCFLFCGSKGTGKTTLGGIVANHLKCDPNELYEVNSGHFRGIDTVRELEKDIRYRPKKGNVRIWIFNECHKWTNDAQNAMLDLMEKCPDHVYLILTTTDPQKLISPLVDRCVKYETTPLTDDEMFDFLIEVVEAENADVPDDILEKIITVAQGGSRAALQLLEQVIDLPIVEMKNVAMKIEDQETVTKNLIDAMLKQRPWAEVAKILKSLTAEPEEIRRSVLGYASAILLNGANNKRAAIIIDCFSQNTYDTGKAGIIKAAYEATL